MIIIGIVLSLICAVVIWFIIPFSPTRKAFYKDAKRIAAKHNDNQDDEVFSAEDFSAFPEPIRKYFENCGYIGKPKMSFITIDFKNVSFLRGKNVPALTIDYTQYNFTKEPSRIALIDSKMFGVPFEGYDYYDKGVGGMKGVVGKIITIFNQRGAEMDKACLATYLSECLFIPTVLNLGYITFTPISEYETGAVIEYNGQTARGIFSFNENYEMISFRTEDRALIDSNKEITHIPWTASCGGYKVNDNGINFPTQFKAIWNYPEEDFVYFNGNINSSAYDIVK